MKDTDMKTNKEHNLDWLCAAINALSHASASLRKTYIDTDEMLLLTKEIDKLVIAVHDIYKKESAQ
jgi:3',5'-cyclic AMP phosphodiesterase CpdA